MNLEHHLNLLENSARGHAIEAAISRAVGPGSVVLDAGCGSGFLSLLAARAGAARVIGVDTAWIAVARELVRSNGFESAIELIQEDLRQLTRLGKLPRFDVILGMVYYNDPRRDEAQSQMMHGIIRQLLRPGGSSIPDRVRYGWQVVDWPEQTFSRIERTLEARARRLAKEYGFDFSTLKDMILRQPQRSWFPRRRGTGDLDTDGARPLGEATEAFTIDYGSSRIDYPETLCFAVAQEGTATTVIWTQELLFDDVVLFSNQSVSWLDPAISCHPGSRVCVRLDSKWRRTNVAPAWLEEDHRV